MERCRLCGELVRNHEWLKFGKSGQVIDCCYNEREL